MSKASFSSVIERLRRKSPLKNQTEIEALPRDGRALPLSSTQQRLWFIEQLYPGAGAYNIGMTIALHGHLDRTVLAAAFRRVVERHESLRTAFDDQGGEPYQAIAASVELPMPLIDLGAVEAPWPEVVSVATRLRGWLFDLRRAPLLRTFLLRRSPGEHVLVASLHHIVGDGWSLGILFKELLTFYRALASGEEPPLPALPVQYADYAAWQRKAFDVAALAPHLEFWLRHLRGSPPVLELPLDRPRPPVPSHRGAMCLLSFSPQLSTEARGLARRFETTLFVVLMAAFQSLLQRMSGHDDFVIGTPIANRDRGELQNLIGFFANTLALRVQLSPGVRFAEHVRGVHELMLEAHRHQGMPFERLVEALSPERSLSHTPLFQVLFTFRNVPMPRFELPGLVIEPIPVGASRSIFDLTLHLDEGADRLAGWFEYSTDLFDATTLTRLGSHFRALLAAVAADPEARLTEIVLTGAAERHQVLVEWNDTRWDARVSPARSLSELFEDAARRHPEALAVVFGEEALSYRGLAGRTERLARRLGALGIGPEVHVGVALERSVEMVVALLGILMAGAAYVPLDPAHPRQRLAAMMSDARLAALLTRGHDRDRLEAPAGMPVLTLDDANEIEIGSMLAPLPGDLHAAYVIFTSGSTGRPKATVVPHRGVVNRLAWIEQLYPLGGGDRVLQKTAFTFDVSVWEFFWPLTRGATLVMARPGEHADPAALARRIERARIDVVHFVPSMLRVFLEHPDAARCCAGLRRVFASGEALPDDLCRSFFARFGLPLENLYGPTETSIEVTHWRGRPESVQRVSIGRPIGNVRIHLLDRRWRPVPLGVAGELAIGGVAVARGYFGRPGLTAERFVPDPFAGRDEAGARLYKSGDLSRFLHDGQIEYLGRIDTQVKVRGFRVELGEIEGRLREHPAVREAAVVAVSDAPGGTGSGHTRLVAYVVARDSQAAPSLEQLQPFLRETLPEHMMPALLILLAAMPLGSSGKLDRRALPPPRFATAKARFEPPRTPLEEVLAAVWSEVLGVETVGIRDSFFELGGHSLLASRVIARAQGALGLEIPIRALFEAPTVAGLAEVVAARRGGGARAAPPLVRAKGRENPPLSFAQERLWFLDQLSPDSPAYNMVSLWRLRGALATPPLERALAEVVRRHEALRSVFPAVEGEPRLVILETVVPHLPVIDLGTLGPAVLDELLRHARRDAERPFSLARGPLLRTWLWRAAADEHYLWLAMHHIVSDGWSAGVLMREVASLYVALQRGSAPALPELAVQYADFARWQRAWLAEGELERQIAYWRRQLAGAPARLELPFDRPRPAVQDYRGRTLETRLQTALLARLQTLGRRNAATLYMTLLAAFAVVLGRLTGQGEVVIGSPVAGRTRPEIEGLVGFFVNLLPLRIALASTRDFADLLARVREVAIDAFGHQDLPFEKLVAELALPRQLSHAPLCQVLLALDNTPAPSLELEDLELSAVALGNVTSRFELSLALRETAGRLEGVWSWSASLFDATTIRRLDHRLRRLLTTVAEDEPPPWCALAPLDRAEAHQLLIEPNTGGRTETAGEARGFHHLLIEQTRRHPEAIALRYGTRVWSYQELERQALALAAQLRDLGLAGEARIGVHLTLSPELVVALLGTLAAGGVFVPLDPSLPPSRLCFLAADSGVVRILSSALGPALPAELAQRAVSVEALVPALVPPAAGDVHALGPAEPGRLAYVIYTSGSTGQPKGVMVTHRSLVNYLRWAGEVLLEGGRLRIPATTKPSFDAALKQLLAPLLAGSEVWLPETEAAAEPAAFLAEIRRRRPVCWNGVPSLWRLLLEQIEPGGAEPGVRRLLLGGEALAPELAACTFAALPGVEIHNLYGPTEATANATAARVAPGAPVTLGRPIAGARVFVLDRERRPAALGQLGELCLAGPGLARGYLGRPALTAERFEPCPFPLEPGERLYATGDRVRWLARGELEYRGRLDEQLKLRGLRIEPGEIEAALLQHPAVRAAAVVARARGDAPEELHLVAYLVGAPRPPAQQLRRFLAQSLPEALVPAVFVWLETLPTTPTGKLDRRALPAPAPLAPTTGAETTTHTPTEELIAGIFAEVLGIEQVDAETSFFELGGHSLRATQAISRLQRSFGVAVTLRQLFQAPTVRALAEIIGAALAADGATPPPILPAARDQPLPLSFAQERLWFLDQLEPGSAAYNLPLALRLRGPLRPAVLERGLAEIVRRHETLRTRFLTRAGSPVQEILPAGAWSLPVVDLAALAAARERAALHLAAEAASRPFDLAAGGLLRAALLRLSGTEHVLLLSLHHVVSDGWSTGVLVRELVALYRAFAAGEPSPLPELEIQYADFALWQRQWLAAGELERQLGYWRRQLAGAPAALDLPADRPRPPAQRFRGAVRERRLSGALSGALAQLARREGATLFMTLLAAWAALLARLSGQDDVVVGTPIAGRNRAEIEGLIGFFVNTLVLRCDLAGEPSFVELLGRVRELSLGAYAHQDLPFARLVETLEVERALDRSPLFQVMLIFQNTPAVAAEVAGLELQPLAVPGRTAKFDLTLALGESAGTLVAAAEHDTDLFDGSTIERWLGHYERLLDAVVAAPAARLARLAWLGAAERHQLLIEHNDTAVVPAVPGCLDELLGAQATRVPEAIAVSFEESFLSYRELDRRARRLARHLRRLGVGPEHVVGLLAERSAAMVEGLLAILQAGAAYLPLDPSYPPPRLAYMLRHAQARVLLCSAGMEIAELGFEGTVVTLGADLAPTTSAVAWPSVSAASLAYVIYTSGSTGQPKGVQICHGALVSFLRSTSRRPGLDATDTLLAVTTLSFDIAGLELFLPLSAGARIDLAARATASDAGLLAQRLETARASVMQATPATWQLLLLADWRGAPGLRALCGGEALAPALARQLHARVGAVWNLYGPTETTIWSAVESVEREPRSVAIGRPIADTSIHLLDPRGEPVPLGVAGELCIGGAGVARGYRERPGQTAERFVPDRLAQRSGARIYRTGDLARRWADGRLEHLGRLDFQVKLRGFRIELGEIETALAEHPQLREGVVTAQTGATGPRLVAWVAGAGAGVLREHLRRRLPEYMVPAVFVELEALPRLPNGKVDRGTLARRPPAPRDLACAHGAAPRDAVELRLAQIFAEVLGLPAVTIGESFFELGGHSLLAVRLVALIEHVFGRRLALAALFAAPSVERLAAVLRRQPGAATAHREPLVAIRPSGSRRPLFCVHPVGGNVFCYLELARELGDEQPVYGLQTPELPVGDGRLETLAERYVAAIREAQPAGPYLLAGWSMGGMVAFEMARQLVAAGEPVELVAMIDPPTLADDAGSPADLDPAATIAGFVHDLTGGRVTVELEELRALARREQIARALERVQSAGALPPDADAGALEQLYRVFESNLRALRAYRPRYYAGRVVCWHTAALAAPPSWAALAAAVELRPLAGDHYSILRSSEVQVLAAQLATEIAGRSRA